MTLLGLTRHMGRSRMSRTCGAIRVRLGGKPELPNPMIGLGRRSLRVRLGRHGWRIKLGRLRLRVRLGRLGLRFRLGRLGLGVGLGRLGLRPWSAGIIRMGEKGRRGEG